MAKHQKPTTNTAKQKYVIPVTYEMAGLITIEANSAEEAANIADEHIDELPLPTDAEYIDGSYSVESDTEIIGVYTREAAQKGKYPTSFTPS